MRARSAARQLPVSLRCFNQAGIGQGRVQESVDEAIPVAQAERQRFAVTYGVRGNLLKTRNYEIRQSATLQVGRSLEQILLFTCDPRLQALGTRTRWILLAYAYA